MHTQTFTTELAGKTLTAEHTDLTNQANGSIMLRYGETVILVTATMGHAEQVDLPYFPLSVEFVERFCSPGDIQTEGFMRQSDQPSEAAILSARRIDRAIRPLFDTRLRRDVQVVVTVLALGDEAPDVLGVIGASLALSISDIPWNGPIGAVRIARQRETGFVLINPADSDRIAGGLDFEILTCGQAGSINMIETAAHETGEDDVLAVLEASTAIHAELELFQTNIIQAVGKAKYVIPTTPEPTNISTLYTEVYANQLCEKIFNNQTGKEQIEKIIKTFVTAATQTDETITKRVATDFIKQKISNVLHQEVIRNQRRTDGRTVTEIRPLFAQAGDISPALHGSGIFYRGETHVFTTLTLTALDEVHTDNSIQQTPVMKNFIHRYAFPPFSVGETGRVGGFNRRMIGHGALAEKALAPVVPTTEDFPYAIRLLSETLASNGSSSMAEVCASTLALLDGDVPLLRPVAGVAIGVLINDTSYQLLTDIQGPEDEYGDMDLKVAGTSAGITAIQMDVNVPGISLDILAEALAAAKQARLDILDMMTKCIAEPRP